MTDKIKVLPNITRKKSNDNSEVLAMLDASAVAPAGKVHASEDVLR